MTSTRVGNHGRLVEVAGVAGAGKSTLARGLGAVPDGPTTIGTLRTSDPRHIGSVLRGAPAALATALEAWRRGAPLSWVEVKAVLYLAGYDPVAHAAPVGPGTDRGRPSWVLVDQGPAYSLARLLVRGGTGPALLPGGRRWRRLVDRWATMLDVVVLLHAPVEVLLRRIGERDQDHEVKDAPPEAAASFVAAYTEAYDLVLGELGARGVVVHRLDSAELDPDEVLRAVMLVLDDVTGAGRARLEADT